MTGDLPWPPPPPLTFVPGPVSHLATESGAALCGDAGEATVVVNDCDCAGCLRRCLTAYLSMFSELTPIFYAMPWFAGDEHIGADLGRRLTESVLPLLPPEEDE